jgi:hyperosmotically inducible periplasmic protein
VKAVYSVALTILIVAVVALLVLGMPVQATNMDDRIKSLAKMSYVFKTFLKGDDIKIQSRDGAVTLTGVVSEESHKSLALETVAGLPGVQSVDSRLEVKCAPTTANSDSWLMDKVKVTLLFHRSVSAVKTEVYVKDGIVTLRGHAVCQAQKELTTEYVWDVKGVNDVKNEMTVSKTSKKVPRTAGGKIDDASITAQVKMALLLHRSTSALHTQVETNRGIVTVGGKARNAAEKDLVTKLVNDLNGVKSVKNWMIVDRIVRVEKKGEVG